MSRKWKIRHLIAASTLVIVLSLTAFLSLLISDSVSSGMESRIRYELTQRARQAADRFDQFLWSRRQDMLFLSRFETLFLSGNPDGIRESLNRLKAAVPMFAWIGYADLTGAVAAGTGGILEGVSIADRPVFTEGMKGSFMGDVHEAVLLARLLPNPTGETMKFVDMSFRIDGADGKPRGVLAAHIDWQWIEELRDSFLAGDPEKDTDLLILSGKDDQIILGPGESLGTLNRSFNESFTDPEGSFLDPGEGGGPDFLYGYARSRGYADFGGFGWVVLVRESTRAADAIISAQTGVVWGTGFLAALLAGVAAWFISGAVAQPLVTLLRQSEAVRLGDLNILPSRTGILEISGLADSLNDLAKDLLRMEKIALRDHLTGLYNRAGAKEWIAPAAAHAQREGLCLGILIIDLDGFKPVNDRWGHEAGDAVLQEVARRLAELARTDELVARWGGDEFVAVTYSPVGSASGLEALAGRMLEYLRKPIFWEGTELRVNCSIGGTLWDPESGKAWEEALKTADQGLYRSKRSGKDRFTLA